jgi:hypothetical protein
MSENEDDLSIKHKPREAQGELKKVMELIEKFTNHLSEKENEKNIAATTSPSHEQILAEASILN